MTQTILPMHMILKEDDEDQHKAKANTSTMMITRAKPKAMLEAEAIRRWQTKLCDGAWHVAMPLGRMHACQKMMEAHLGTQGWPLLYVCKSVAGAQSGPTDGTQRTLEVVCFFAA